jgi:hypothetical protein
MKTGILDNVQRIVTNGLVLNLDAGNPLSYPGSGSTWTDISGNSLNATLNNGPTFDSANGGSIVFDGTDDYGTIPDSSILDFTGSPMSICTWINRVGNAAPQGEEIIIHKESGISVIGGYQYSINGNTGAYSLRIRNSSSGNDTFTGSTGSVITGNWVLLCLTYDNSTIRGYVNGSFDSSLSSTISIGNTNNPMGICSTYLGNGNFGNYKVASINIYNRALSALEVTQNFNALKSRFGL